MHYHAEIWVQDNIDIDAKVESIMAPHEANYNDETMITTGFWDWHQIGGRWSGAHDPTYDPETDPANVHECNQCHGTGFRNDEVGRAARAKIPSYTCNACGKFDSDEKLWRHGPHGPGKLIKWATNWARFPGDITAIADLPTDLDCYTLIVNDQVFHREEWINKEFLDTDFNGAVLPKLHELGITTGYLVTVDYHT